MSNMENIHNGKTSATRRLFVLGSLLALGACAKSFHDPVTLTSVGSYDDGPPGDLAVLTYRAVDRLLRATPQLTVAVPLVVSSITDSQRIDQSSSFGTIIADLVKSRLSQEQMTVLEPRLRSSMLLKKDQGEMMLARDSRAIVPGPMYSCVLTGTYAAAGSRVYVALKLISTDDSRIVSAVDFVVWRDSDINRLLAEGMLTRV